MAKPWIQNPTVLGVLLYPYGLLATSLIPWNPKPKAINPNPQTLHYRLGLRQFQGDLAEVSGLLALRGSADDVPCASGFSRGFH